ncbi:MAG: hypothetical protein AAFZ52_06135, partial [Bacteroidota bacterium]
MWKNDRVGLLYGFRGYVRYIAYGFIHRPASIGLGAEDFTGLLATVKRRREQLEKEPVLKAYWDTITLLRKELAEVDKGEVDRLLSFLYGNQGRMDREDYIDLVGMIFNFCTRWVNEGNRDLLPELLRASILMIDGKYGEGWSPRRDRDVWLQHHIFSNNAVLALKLNRRRNWRNTRMALFEPPAEGVFPVEEWAEAYVQVYQSRVHRDYRKWVVAYVRARVAVHQGDFSQAATLLRKLKERP